MTTAKDSRGRGQAEEGWPWWTGPSWCVCVCVFLSAGQLSRRSTLRMTKAGESI